MVKHFLKYWLDTTVQRELQSSDPYLDYSASSQYSRVQPGDEVWFVTVPLGSGQLILFGHMQIAWIGGIDEAAIRLNKRPNQLWEAELYALAAPYAAEMYDPIDITGIAAELRFESKGGFDRLRLQDGKVNAQAFQSMRQLKPESASLLQEIWYSGNDVPAANVHENAPMILSYNEGKRKLQIHFRRERNQRLVAVAKQLFKDMHGKITCEVCGFDFSQRYGELGADYIEAHHRNPFAETEDESIQTRVDDLAMVCANCHRMLHRHKPWLKIEDLQSRIQS